MENVKGFITNLGKYNEGMLVGDWVTFPIDDDELTEVLKRIGCAYTDEEGKTHNGEYEEYFFTDWDGVDFGEYVSIDELNELAETWEGNEELLEAVAELYCKSELFELSPDGFRLYGDINDDYDLGYYWAEESGTYDLKELGNLANYIDYEAFGRDIRLEADGGFTSCGWLERI